ncbi:MAG: transposase [Blastochloris sp.]|nr:transposase [Blastochloris sp.]
MGAHHRAIQDQVFHEDQSRIRVGNADQNMAVLGHIAMNMVRQEPSKGSMRFERKRAGWDNDYFPTVLGL